MKIKQISPTSVGVSIHPTFLKVSGLELGDNVIMDAKKGIITITKQEDKDNE